MERYATESELDFLEEKLKPLLEKYGFNFVYKREVKSLVIGPFCYFSFKNNQNYTFDIEYYSAYLMKKTEGDEQCPENLRITLKRPKPKDFSRALNMSNRLLRIMKIEEYPLLDFLERKDNQSFEEFITLFCDELDQAIGSYLHDYVFGNKFQDESIMENSSLGYTPNKPMHSFATDEELVFIETSFIDVLHKYGINFNYSYQNRDFENERPEFSVVFFTESHRFVITFCPKYSYKVKKNEYVHLDGEVLLSVRKNETLMDLSKAIKKDNLPLSKFLIQKEDQSIKEFITIFSKELDQAMNTTLKDYFYGNKYRVDYRDEY